MLDDFPSFRMNQMTIDLDVATCIVDGATYDMLKNHLTKLILTNS